MNVYYSDSLYMDERTAEQMRLESSPEIQYTDWEFEHGGCKHLIPRIYHFTEGIVIDILTQQDAEAAKRYMERFQNAEHVFGWQWLVDTTSFYWPSVQPVQINDSATSQTLGHTSYTYMPWENTEPLAQELISIYLNECNYFIHKDSCFSVTRVQIPYSNGKELINSLSMTFTKKEYLMPFYQEFELPGINYPKTEISFIHPETGASHVLEIGVLQELEVENPSLDNIPNPFKALKIVYQVVPPLASKEYLRIVEVPHNISDDNAAFGYGLFQENTGDENEQNQKVLSQMEFTGAPAMKNLSIMFTQPATSFSNGVRCSFIGIYNERVPETIIRLPLQG